MADKPILFSGPMVRAILEGRKTMTRRVLKPQPRGNQPFRIRGDGAVCDTTGYACSNGKNSILFCKYEAGDRLWVRETWRQAYAKTSYSEGIVYRADKPRALGMDEYSDRHTWKPSIFMPRKFSRITLEVTGVKVERLQDISEEDAKAEGATYHPPSVEDIQWYKSYCEENGGDSTAPMDGVWQVEGVKGWGPTPQFAFRNLWTTINGPGSWEANPWVPAYSFKRVE